MRPFTSLSLSMKWNWNKMDLSHVPVWKILSFCTQYYQTSETTYNRQRPPHPIEMFYSVLSSCWASSLAQCQETTWWHLVFKSESRDVRVVLKCFLLDAGSPEMHGNKKSFPITKIQPQSTLREESFMDKFVEPLLSQLPTQLVVVCNVWLRYF